MKKTRPRDLGDLAKAAQFVEVVMGQRRGCDNPIPNLLVIVEDQVTASASFLLSDMIP